MGSYSDEPDWSQLPPQARYVLNALSQFNRGEIVTERCPKCGEIIAVEGRMVGTDRPNVWFISCRCGFCNDTMKGL